MEKHTKTKINQLVNPLNFESFQSASWNKYLVNRHGFFSSSKYQDEDIINVIGHVQVVPFPLATVEMWNWIKLISSLSDIKRCIWIKTHTSAPFNGTSKPKPKIVLNMISMTMSVCYWASICDDDIFIECWRINEPICIRLFFRFISSFFSLMGSYVHWYFVHVSSSILVELKAVIKYNPILQPLNQLISWKLEHSYHLLSNLFCYEMKEEKLCLHHYIKKICHLADKIRRW